MRRGIRGGSWGWGEAGLGAEGRWKWAQERQEGVLVAIIGQRAQQPEFQSVRQCYGHSVRPRVRVHAFTILGRAAGLVATTVTARP